MRVKRIEMYGRRRDHGVSVPVCSRRKVSQHADAGITHPINPIAESSVSPASIECQRGDRAGGARTAGLCDLMSCKGLAYL